MSTDWHRVGYRAGEELLCEGIAENIKIAQEKVISGHFLL